jgi:hypothetical protein
VLLLGEFEDLCEEVLVVQHSEFFLADLVEQSEVSIGPEADECADLVAGVLHSVVLCDVYLDGFSLGQRLDLDFDLFGLILQLSNFFRALLVVEEVSSELDLGCAEDRKGLFLFFFGKVGPFETTDSDALRHAESLLVGTAGNFIEIFREVEVVQKIGGIAFDNGVVEQFHENLSDDEFSGLDDLGLVAVEPAFLETVVLGDLEGVLVVCLHGGDHIADVGEPHMEEFFEV